MCSISQECVDVSTKNDVSINDMTSRIKKYVEGKKFRYIDISNDTSVFNIYNMIFNNTIIHDDDDVTSLYFGIQYEILKDYDNMIKYYLMAGNSAALDRLGRYYDQIDDIGNMKKYYLLAIIMGSDIAMAYLANYFNKIGDIKNMKIYYLMAINKGNKVAMNNFAVYYESINDIKNMKKYFMMAIDQGDSTAMNNFAVYYESINDIKNMKKYYMMAIDQGDSTAMNNFAFYFGEIKDVNNMKKYYTMAIENDHLISMNNLARFYYLNKEYEKSLQLYMQAVSKGNNDMFNDVLKCIKKCNSLSQFIDWWKYQVKYDNDKNINDNDVIIDVIIHFIDNKIVNDELFDIFVKLTLAPSTKYIYQLFQTLLRSKIELIKLHYDYAPGQNGYESAKQHFINNII